MFLLLWNLNPDAGRQPALSALLHVSGVALQPDCLIGTFLILLADC